jgi:hypothetical protein
MGAIKILLAYVLECHSAFAGGTFSKKKSGSTACRSNRLVPHHHFFYRVISNLFLFGGV